MAKYHGMNGAIWINGSKWATGVSYHVTVNRPTVNLRSCLYYSQLRIIVAEQVHGSPFDKGG